MDLNLNYLQCIAIKYIFRWKKKDGIKDLKKALHSLEKLEDYDCKRNSYDCDHCMNAERFFFMYRFLNEHPQICMNKTRNENYMRQDWLIVNIALNAYEDVISYLKFFIEETDGKESAAT